jgi:Flp pilus assembly protein TadD
VIVAVLLAAAIAATPAPSAPPSAPIAAPISLAEIDRAIAMRRFDQARLMIAAMVRGGASGAAIERPLAALSFATGHNADALARTLGLLQSAPGDALLLEQATIAALRLGDSVQAAALGKRAIAAPAASWRAWNAFGVIADATGDWGAADHAFARAEALAPGHYEVANNRGWSLLLRGDWEAAREVLEQAAGRAPDAERTANNLDLARMGLAGDLPTRRGDENSAAYAARLNDAGVAARMRGEPERARAAFAQAIEASASWYSRAGDNLAAVESGR